MIKDVIIRKKQAGDTLYMVQKPKAATRFNKAGHAAHKMPARPTLDQRWAWHKAHGRHCGCGKAPKNLQKIIKALIEEGRM